MSSRHPKPIFVSIFAVFFGLLEATVVIYLRQLFSLLPQIPDYSSHLLFSLGFISFLSPQSSASIITLNPILTFEIYREAATIIMLLALSLAVSHRFLERLAYFFLSFALWDIFYYVFLYLFIGWPKSLFDQDIFFLIPFPWVGPVITPLVISSLLILFSLFILRKSSKINS